MVSAARNTRLCMLCNDTYVPRFLSGILSRSLRLATPTPDREKRGVWIIFWCSDIWHVHILRILLVRSSLLCGGAFFRRCQRVLKLLHHALEIISFQLPKSTHLLLQLVLRSERRTRAWYALRPCESRSDTCRTARRSPSLGPMQSGA